MFDWRLEWLYEVNIITSVTITMAESVMRVHRSNIRRFLWCQWSKLCCKRFWLLIPAVAVKKTGFPPIQHREPRGKYICQQTNCFALSEGEVDGGSSQYKLFLEKGRFSSLFFFGYWGISSQSNLWRNQSYVMPILALISNLSTKYFRQVFRTPPRDFEPHMIVHKLLLFLHLFRGNMWACGFHLL